VSSECVSDGGRGRLAGAARKIIAASTAGLGLHGRSS